MTPCYSIVLKVWLYKGLRGKYTTGKILSEHFSLKTGKSPSLHTVSTAEDLGLACRNL